MDGVYDLIKNIDLEFTPLYNHYSSGNNIQMCKTKYKGINIIVRTIFWYNIFKEPTDIFTIDLCLPDTTKVENGTMEQYYEPDGYAAPTTQTLQDAINFIDKYKKQHYVRNE